MVAVASVAATPDPSPRGHEGHHNQSSVGVGPSAGTLRTPLTRAGSSSAPTPDTSRSPNKVRPTHPTPHTPLALVG
jgi:hypothetical protein